MGDGFKVVPQALRAAQQPFQDAAHAWVGLDKDLGGWKLADGDLGLIGRATKIVDLYNNAVGTVQAQLKTGATNLQAASDQLDAVAKKYEAQDEQYYDQFGYTDANLNSVSQPGATTN
jgi:hypothetical protein